LLRQSAIVAAISSVATLVLLWGSTRLGVLTGSFPRTAPIIDGMISFILIVASRVLIAQFNRKEAIQSNSPLEVLKTNWRKWLREGIVYYGILGGALGIYMLWSKFAFGTFSPVSGQIKRWWGSFPSRVYGGAARSSLSFFGIGSEGDFNAWAPITNLAGKWNNLPGMSAIRIDYDLRYALIFFLFVIVLFLLLFLNRKRARRITAQLALMPLFAGASLQVIQYNLTGYSALKEWYWVPQMVFITLAGGTLLDILSQPLRRFPITRLVLYLPVLYYGIASGLWFWHVATATMLYGAKPADTPYMEAATFIEKYTEPGSLVGMTGGGNVGYFIRGRTIVNMDGLISSYSYFQANKAYRGSDYLYEMGLDYIFANPTFLEVQPYRGQYTDRLEIIDYYGGKAIMRFLPAP
jgi:hypothetical protein